MKNKDHIKANEDHWEVHYKEYPPNDSKNLKNGSGFNPMKSKDRYKTYIPVNETDH